MLTHTSANLHVVVKLSKAIYCSIVQEPRAALSYLRVLPSPDHNVLSFLFCLSTHPYPAAESGNAASDRAVEIVMMRAVLKMSHTPGRPEVPRRSLVLIALPGALATDQSNVLRHAPVVRIYYCAELAV